jgi:hypothetical protein
MKIVFSALLLVGLVLVGTGCIVVPAHRGYAGPGYYSHRYHDHHGYHCGPTHHGHHYSGDRLHVYRR